MLDAVRDESSKDAPVRLVFEPKTSRIEQDELHQHAAGAHQPRKLDADQPDDGRRRRPADAEERCARCCCEWIDFRLATVERRSRHRLGKVADRIHILEGRQLVLLNIDEVIAIIRAADEPKAALIERFTLSERQAEDILEIRLRQLARLEAIKIEQELKDLRDEEAKLRRHPRQPGGAEAPVVTEIEADAKPSATRAAR